MQGFLQNVWIPFAKHGLYTKFGGHQYNANTKGGTMSCWVSWVANMAVNGWNGQHRSIMRLYPCDKGNGQGDDEGRAYQREN